MDVSLELGREVLRSNVACTSSDALGLVPRLNRATLAALVKKDDLATGAHPVFSEVTLDSSSQGRSFTI